MRVNVKTKAKFNPAPILEAGATKTFDALTELNRLTSCCLLGEDTFYVSGQDIQERMKEVVDKVDVEDVAKIAVHARLELGLRHAPLMLLNTLAPRNSSLIVRDTAGLILRTPKDAMDLIALYWKNGKRPLPNAYKAAIRDGFSRWTDYQIAKYATLTNVNVRLRDLLFLSHAKPSAERGPVVFKMLADDTLKAPDTWESALSVPGADKQEVWTRLLKEGKLGALALVRNLRNMEQVGVDPALVTEALSATKANDIWPWQALAAAREAPGYTHQLDEIIVRSAGRLQEIPGHTVVMVDVSGSMDAGLSHRGSMSRMDAAAGLATVFREVCDQVTIGSFSDHYVQLKGKTLPRGTTLAKAIIKSQTHSGTHLASSIDEMLRLTPEFDRLVILTDEQAHSPVFVRAKQPTFIVNLAPYSRGVDWEGPITRINGWSGGVVRFLANQITGQMPTGSESEDDETED